MSIFQKKDQKTEDSVVNHNIPSIIFQQKVIDSQIITGDWAHDEDKHGVLHLIKEKYDKEYKIVLDKLKQFGNESEHEKNLVITILVVLILYKEYSNLKNEFCCSNPNGRSI